MLYLAYEMQTHMAAPLRAAARHATAAFGAWCEGASIRGQDRDWRDGWLGGLPAWRAMAAGWEMVARAGLTHGRPGFGIDAVKVGRRQVPVHEEAALTAPFGTLLRFRKEGEAVQPKVLLVAPLSGHFATLLRGTVRTLLQDHDVYLTDWHNAREVPLADGRFGFDEYVGHLIRYLEFLGPGAHVVAVCQPCVQALVAAAAMAEEGHPAQPASLTLMAGPVDTRVNPTEVNRLATGRPIAWFERNLIARVPPGHPGAGRRVYPGFVQLMAFMAMNPDRHVKAHGDLFRHLALGDTDRAEAIRTFYDEYFAVLDLPAEFYLETVQTVFQEALLAQGTADVPRPSDPARRDPPHRPADRGRRARRYLRNGPDGGRAGSLLRAETLSEAPPPAGRCRPLRRLQRPPLGRPDLPDRPQPHPRQRIGRPPARPLPRLFAAACRWSIAPHDRRGGRRWLRTRARRWTMRRRTAWTGAASSCWAPARASAGRPPMRWRRSAPRCSASTAIRSGRGPWRRKWAASPASQKRPRAPGWSRSSPPRRTASAAASPDWWTSSAWPTTGRSPRPTMRSGTGISRSCCAMPGWRSSSARRHWARAAAR